MTGGTRAPALSQHGHVCPLGEAPGRGGGSPGSRDTGRSGFLGPPLRRDPAPSGILTFRGVAKPRGARGAHSLRAARARLRNALLWASQKAPLGPYLGFTRRARRGRRRWSLWPTPGALSPWAGSGASRPAGESSFLLPLSAQRAGSLFPPGRRGRSRAAGWRGRAQGSAGCGTRRESAAPASGPRPWVAPWDAETPCCAAGRAGPGLGSGCPRRERGSRAGGNARPGSEMAEWGERPRGRGRGSCLEGRPIP